MIKIDAHIEKRQEIGVIPLCDPKLIKLLAKEMETYFDVNPVICFRNNQCIFETVKQDEDMLTNLYLMLVGFRVALLYFKEHECC